MLIDALDFMKLSYLKMQQILYVTVQRKKKTFTTYASELNRLVKYLDRNDVDYVVRKEYEAIAAIYAQLKKNISMQIQQT